MVFTAFWQTFFKLPSNTFKIYEHYTFQFLKFPWEKYNPLGAEEDDQMFFLHNDFLLYIFKCKCYGETGLYRLSSFNLITRSTVAM